MEEYTDNLKLFKENLSNAIKIKGVTRTEAIYYAISYLMNDGTINAEEINTHVKEDLKKIENNKIVKKNLFTIYAVSVLLREKKDVLRNLTIINNYYDILKEKAKKHKYIFTFTSIGLTIFQLIGEENSTKLLDEANSIFEIFKKDHKFLTNATDYPIAIIYAQKHLSPNNVEILFQKFKNNNFTSNKGLQTLCQLLALNEDLYIDITVNKISSYYNKLKERKLKISSENYLSLAVLDGLVEDNNVVVDLIEKIYLELKEIKNLKISGKQAMITAAIFLTFKTLSKKSKDNSFIDSLVFYNINRAINQRIAIMTIVTTIMTTVAII